MLVEDKDESVYSQFSDDSEVMRKFKLLGKANTVGYVG
jgi:hypothetical protein